MKTKIFEALKTKYSNLGFNKDVLEGVATNLSAFVKEEDQIATAVDGAESMLKSFQSFADGRVNTFKTESEKNKTEAEQLKARLAELEKNPADPTKPTVEVPEYMKTVLEKMESMQNTITGFQSARNSQSLKEKFVAEMAAKKVPESFYKTTLIGREFKDETEMNEFVGSVATGYEAHEQELSNLGFSFTKPPEGGTKTVQKESEELAAMITKGTKEIVEQNKN